MKKSSKLSQQTKLAKRIGKVLVCILEIDLSTIAFSIRRAK